MIKTEMTDVLIIGASAAGLMCAIEAGKRGRSVKVVDHANKAGKKILMSGGGRCNFTNMEIDARHYLSHNPHFCKSALNRYTQWDFMAIVAAHNIAYHERDLGKLFCDDSAKDILDMLLKECAQAGVEIVLNCEVYTAKQDVEGAFSVRTALGEFSAARLIIASGGLSIPKMCASPIGYKIAEYFGHNIWPTQAGLVPFTLQPEDKLDLAGIAVEAKVSNERAQFTENVLFTHRGLSGPAILQISSYWQAGETININLLPAYDLETFLKDRQAQQPNIVLKTALTELLPKRLLQAIIVADLLDTRLQSFTHQRFKQIAKTLQQWRLKPSGTEGYRTAEVTLGGVDCNELSSKTMESNLVPGLYFIGEIVDVTGWLGGYNFQWAWSSGWSAGQVV
ncbi:MAG: NAD(P)/FAD-dependent oxidoreductase [Arenicellales bacterium]